MKFYTITPSAFMQDAFLTSDTTLILSHLVKEGNKYCKAVEKFKRLGGKVILDNSYYEYRRNLTVAEMKEKCRIVKPDIFTLPDIPLRINTRFILEDTIERLRQSGVKSKFMSVVFANGKDFKEDLALFVTLLSVKGIDTIAIPYVFRKEDEFRRNNFLSMIEKNVDVRNIKQNIHLFGVNSFEKLKKENKFWITSCDSTLPWKCGYKKIKLPIKDFQDPKRPSEYFDINNITEEQREIITYNLKYVKEYVK